MISYLETYYGFSLPFLPSLSSKIILPFLLSNESGRVCALSPGSTSWPPPSPFFPPPGVKSFYRFYNSDILFQLIERDHSSLSSTSISFLLIFLIMNMVGIAKHVWVHSSDMIYIEGIEYWYSGNYWTKKGTQRWFHKSVVG